MKSILFYGDSNTWGFDPGTTLRYPYSVRWTSICASLLGSGYNCIPAGMNGRTTVFDDPIKGSRNGIKGLDYELQTHKPLDLFAVMLGTNDLKYTDAEGSAAGMERLIELVMTANQRYNLSSPVFPDSLSLPAAPSTVPPPEPARIRIPPGFLTCIKKSRGRTACTFWTPPFMPSLPRWMASTSALRGTGRWARLSRRRLGKYSLRDRMDRLVRRDCIM